MGRTVDVTVGLPAELKANRTSLREPRREPRAGPQRRGDRTAAAPLSALSLTSTPTLRGPTRTCSALLDGDDGIPTTTIPQARRRTSQCFIEPLQRPTRLAARERGPNLARTPTRSCSRRGRRKVVGQGRDADAPAPCLGPLRDGPRALAAADRRRRRWAWWLAAAPWAALLRWGLGEVVPDGSASRGPRSPSTSGSAVLALLPALAAVRGTRLALGLVRACSAGSRPSHVRRAGPSTPGRRRSELAAAYLGGTLRPASRSRPGHLVVPSPQQTRPTWSRDRAAGGARRGGRRTPAVPRRPPPRRPACPSARSPSTSSAPLFSACAPGWPRRRRPRPGRGRLLRRVHDVLRLLGAGRRSRARRGWAARTPPSRSVVPSRRGSGYAVGQA